jgi:hypothetical protein
MANPIAWESITFGSLFDYTATPPLSFYLTLLVVSRAGPTAPTDLGQAWCDLAHPRKYDSVED